MALPDEKQMAYAERKRALERNMAAYAAMRESLERDHMDAWVVIRDEELAGTYSCEEDAIKDAVSRFGRGPYHIRQVGAPPNTYWLPSPLFTRPYRVRENNADG